MKRHNKHWTESEIQELIKLYPDSNNSDLVVKFERKLPTILDKAHKLRLKKSKAYLSKINKRYNVGFATRFKPGHKPWNKGLKLGSEWCKRTQFKKGNPAHNKLPKELKELSLLRNKLYKSIKEREKRYAEK